VRPPAVENETKAAAGVPAAAQSAAVHRGCSSSKRNVVEDVQNSDGSNTEVSNG
jgi:hypothetical protein